MAETTDTTTITSGQAAIAQSDQGYGDVLKQGALQEQKASDRIEDAKAEAVVNHDVEHAGDDLSYEETISRDAAEDEDSDEDEVTSTTTDSTTDTTTVAE